MEQQQQQQLKARSLQWTDVQGWFSLDDAAGLGSLLGLVPDGGLVVEIGVAFGRSTVFMGNRTEGRMVRIVSIDNFRGSMNPDDPASTLYREQRRGAVIEKVIDNVVHADMRHRHLLIIADSVQAAALFDDASIDLVYLDADHTVDGVEADLVAWMGKVRRGGILCGHDSKDTPGAVAKRMFGDAFKDTANVWHVTDPVDAYENRPIG